MNVTSALLGIMIAGIILYLIRKDHLHTHHALWWLLSALIIMVLGFFPQLIDWVAHQLNVYYPPTLVLTVGMGMLLLKMLTFDIHQSRQERKIRRLVQRLAILEEEIRRNQKSL